MRTFRPTAILSHGILHNNISRSEHVDVISPGVFFPTGSMC